MSASIAFLMKTGIQALFRYIAAKVEKLPGWCVTKMPCGPDIMIDMPVEWAEILLRLE